MPQVQYVQMPAQQMQSQQSIPPFPAAQHPPQPQQPSQQSLFTSGYVDWSSLPFDTTECNLDADNKMFDIKWGEPDNGRKNFALMAFEGCTSKSALSQRVSRGLNSIWYVDSGGSMHMTGCRNLINNFISQREGSVSFGNNAKGYVLGHGNVSSGKIQFDKVNLVENLEL